jgi:hypothetical protein
MTNRLRTRLTRSVPAKMTPRRMSNGTKAALGITAVVIMAFFTKVLVSAMRSVHPRPMLTTQRSPTATLVTGTARQPGSTPTPATVGQAATSRPSPSRIPVIASALAPRPPTYVGFFTTLPPGAILPSDAQCAREVAPNSWEPRPQNASANQTNVYAQGFRFHSSYFDDFAPAYGARVTGNFSGTTDQILRWAACKWGFDEDTVRAQAEIESDWAQSMLGDCNRGPTQPQTQGCASVGILQVKGADIPPTEVGTWPAAWTSTAFNVDYAMANRRLCFEGKETWLLDFSPTYKAGDLWGCIGNWFSGRWHDAGADSYIQQVQAAKAARIWTTWK